MKRVPMTGAVLVAAGLMGGLLGCPPGPTPPVPEVTEPADAGVEALPPPPDAAPPPPEDVGSEPEAEPVLADPRFAGGLSARPSEGPAPAISPTAPPEGYREPIPDIGEGPRESIRAQFGCQYVAQLLAPAARLSPTGVVLLCCDERAPGAPGRPDAFFRGCLLPHDCSLLIDEGIGALTRVDTVTALRRRVAPLRDPLTALAVVAVMSQDSIPFFGDVPEERALITDRPWRTVEAEIVGTRVVEAAGGGFEVHGWERAVCGCNHDLVRVDYRVDELAGVVETGRTTALADLSGVCVD